MNGVRKYVSLHNLEDTVGISCWRRPQVEHAGITRKLSLHIQLVACIANQGVKKENGFQQRLKEINVVIQPFNVS